MTEEIRTDNTDVIANACKKIAELENQIQIDAEQIRALQKQNGELTDRVKKLQEENEWKTKFENLQKYLVTQNCYRECAETWKKLTEAKKIIKLLSWDIRNRSFDPIKDLEKAEAFLKE